LSRGDRMGIGFPHDRLIADCGLRAKKVSGEWGAGSGVKEVVPQLPTPFFIRNHCQTR